MLHTSSLASTHLPRFLLSHPFAIHRESNSILVNFFQTSSFTPLTISRHIRIRPFCLSPGSGNSPAGEVRAGSQLSGVEDAVDGSEREDTSVGIGSPSLSRQLVMGRISLGDQAFFLLSFIALTTSIAFASLVIAAVPTLIALKKAATSLARLSDTAREELPSTMAAIRLSGMEISDLTLELNDLSQEIADGVNKSAQAVHAAEAGLRQIGAVARQQTITMIQERANLPEISLRPMVARAARKTSDAVGRARTKFINLLSRREQAADKKISSLLNLLGLTC